MDDVAIGGSAVKRRESLTRGITSEEEFRLLFDASFASVVRTVYRITGDRAVAEEVAQEAFIQLHLYWRKVRRYDAPAMWCAGWRSARRSGSDSGCGAAVRSSAR